MQPLNDDELRNIMRRWVAPGVPAALERRVLAAGSPPPLRKLLRWLAAGSIRVPVPVAIAAAVLFVFLMALSVNRQTPAPATLAEFQPVKELKPRIVRSVHDGN
jgi:hypothetical protein